MEYKDLRYELDIASRAQEEAAPAREITTADAATDTDLTPHWWSASDVNEKDVPLADLGRPRARTAETRTKTTSTLLSTPAIKSYASAVGGLAPSDSSEEEVGDDFTVIRRRKKKMPPTNPLRAPVRTRTQKPPAVLVKVKDGQTFEGTLKAIQEAVDPFELGVEVKRISKTQEGHLLFEVKGGPKATADAAALSKAVSSKAGDFAGSVAQLGTVTEVEIVDLDPCVHEEEVLSALTAAVARVNGVETDSLRDQIKITGLWQTKYGQKIASAKVPLFAASKLDVIRVGWTIAKVRPRRPEPPRCYRCHGFGHSTNRCTGPDLTGKCRRCGGAGHLENGCADVHKCVACERLGVTYPEHRTGSSRCEAKRLAEKEMTSDPSHRDG